MDKQQKLTRRHENKLNTPIKNGIKPNTEDEDFWTNYQMFSEMV